MATLAMRMRRVT